MRLPLAALATTLLLAGCAGPAALPDGGSPSSPSAPTTPADPVARAWEAAVAAASDHPRATRVTVGGGALEATFHPAGAASEATRVVAVFGDTPTVSTVQVTDLYPPVPVGDVRPAEVYAAAAQALGCPDIDLVHDPLHSGVPAYRASCESDPDRGVVTIGTQHFPRNDDLTTADGIAQLLAMTRAAGITDIADLYSDTSGTMLDVPRASAELSDGSTCAWTMVPSEGGSLCNGAPKPTAPTITPADLEPHLATTVAAGFAAMEADGGALFDPGYNVAHNAAGTGFEVLFAKADGSFLHYGLDGKRLR